MADEHSDNPSSLESPPAIDTRGHYSAPRRPRTPQPVPVQFGLRGMLWFMVACGAYFSQLSVAVRVVSQRGTRTSVELITIAVGWSLLAVFYWRVRSRRAMVVHCFAVGLFFVGTLFTLPFLLTAPSAGPIDLRAVLNFVEVLLFCCALGSMFSLPAWVLIMIVWALSSERPGKT